MKIKKKSQGFPKSSKALKVLPVKKTKSKNTPAYYHCLAEKASQGCLLKGKVTNCCKECKEQSSQIALNRQREIKKVSEAYKQIGISLGKLLTNG